MDELLDEWMDGYEDRSIAGTMYDRRIYIDWWMWEG